MKRKYVKPSIITHEVIVESGILNASTPLHLGGLNGSDIEYNTLEEENSIDEWIVNDN